MNPNKFFEENEKLLLQIANSQAGRKLLGIEHNLPIVKLTPNSIHSIVDIKKDKTTFEADFFVNERVYIKLAPLATMLFLANDYNPIKNFKEAVEHYSGYNLRNNKYPHIFLTQSDFNPASGGCDAIYITGSYPGVFTATSGTVNGTTEIRTDLSSAYLWRIFYPILTSSLTDAATITAAIFKMYRDDSVDGPMTNANSTRVEIVPSTQASNTSLAAGDLDAITRSSKGNRNFADFPDDTYTDITITDLTVISKTSYTKLAAMTGRDFDQVAPTGSNLMAFQDEAGANPPILRVTYDLPSGGFFFSSNLG